MTKVLPCPRCTEQPQFEETYYYSSYHCMCDEYMCEQAPNWGISFNEAREKATKNWNLFVREYLLDHPKCACDTDWTEGCEICEPYLEK